MTRNNPQKSTHSHGTIIGHITRSELLRHLTEEKLGSGIANRFLFVLVKRSRVLPFGGGEDPITDEQVKSLEKAIEFGKRPRNIEFSHEIEDGVSAREPWEEVYPDLSEGKPGLFGAVVSRAEAQVRRLATVYAVLDCSDEVRCSHLLAALGVWQYAEESAHYIFAERTGDELADLIFEELKAASPDGLTRTQISELFSRHVKATRIRAALRTLEESGKAYMKRQKTGERGAPTERWYARDE
jgi:hypothetical protein